MRCDVEVPRTRENAHSGTVSSYALLMLLASGGSSRSSTGASSGCVE